MAQFAVYVREGYVNGSHHYGRAYTFETNEAAQNCSQALRRGNMDRGNGPRKHLVVPADNSVSLPEFTAKERLLEIIREHRGLFP